jgi:predicted enzyme related to lactoylglutathione lyase
MNNLCHLEFDVTDLERAQTFYGGLFGWTFRSFTPTMVVFGLGDTHIGGLQRVDAVRTGLSPSVWFKVPSLEEYRAKALKLGGKADHPISVVPGVGHSTLVSDPDGNLVGMVQYTD